MGTPYRTAERGSLGPLLSEHRTPSERTRTTAALGAAFAVVGVAAALVFARAGGAGWLGAAMAMLLVVIGGAIAVRAFVEHGTVLRLHELGLEVIRRGESRALRWDDVVELRSDLAVETTSVGAVTWTVDRHVLVLRGGGDVELRCEYPDNDRVLARLRAATEPALVAEAHERLARDGSARFGSLAITEEGIRGPAATIPWTALRGATIRGFAEVVIEGVLEDADGRSDGEVEVHIVEPLARVPNAHVLLALAKRRLAEPVAPSGGRP